MLTRTDTAALTATSLKVLQRDGRRLAVRLEDVYWEELSEIAQADNVSVSELVHSLTANLPDDVNRTSFLRCYCLQYLREKMVLSKITSRNIDVNAIITACPEPVVVLTPQRKIAAYNPAFTSGIIQAGTAQETTAKGIEIRMTFSQPFNRIRQYMIDNPKRVVTGMMGFTIGDKTMQKRVRFALADRSDLENSFVIVFIES